MALPGVRRASHSSFDSQEETPVSCRKDEFVERSFLRCRLRSISPCQELKVLMSSFHWLKNIGRMHAVHPLQVYIHPDDDRRDPSSLQYHHEKDEGDNVNFLQHENTFLVRLPRYDDTLL